MMFILFKSEDSDEWYWNLTAENEEIIAISGDGYKNKQDAIHSLRLVKSDAASASVYDRSKQEWL